MTLGDVDFCAHSAMQLVTVRSNKSDYIMKMIGLFLTGRVGGMVPWLHHDYYVFVASLSHLIDSCLQLGLFSDVKCYQRCQDILHCKRCVIALVLTIS